MKDDSNRPRRNLNAKSRANESIKPEKKVHKLHRTAEMAMKTFLLTLSETTPAKIPAMEYEAVKASPERRP